jgi:hypothetical protein
MYLQGRRQIIEVIGAIMGFHESCHAFAELQAAINSDPW